MAKKYVTLKDLQKKRPVNKRKLRKAVKAIIKASRKQREKDAGK